MLASLLLKDAIALVLNFCCYRQAIIDAHLALDDDLLRKSITALALAGQYDECERLI